MAAKAPLSDCSGSLVNSKYVLAQGFIMWASWKEKQHTLKNKRSNMAAKAPSVTAQEAWSTATDI
jgi:hypothetical protein